jgi:hypothetical protein
VDVEEDVVEELVEVVGGDDAGLEQAAAPSDTIPAANRPDTIRRAPRIQGTPNLGTRQDCSLRIRQ